MLNAVLLFLAAGPLSVTPIGNDCNVWPNHKGDVAVTACRSDDETRLAFVTRDGRTVNVIRMDADIARNAVPTGPAAWSPAGTHVVLEVGLEEEPGVLLIDASDQASVVFVDHALATANVSGAEPQWDASGSWLVFRTSGTGEWGHEGIYAREMKSGAIWKLLAGVPRSKTVAGDALFVTMVKEDDRTKSELRTFSLSALLKQAARMAPQDSARTRSGKD